METILDLLIKFSVNTLKIPTLKKNKIENIKIRFVLADGISREQSIIHNVT